jgi:hypothetical protein
MSLDEPDTEVEELIDLTVPIKKRSNSAATPIDLTSPVRKRSGRRSEGDSRAGPSRKKSKTRPGVSRFIDDEAAESDADGEGSKEPNDSDNAFINDGDDVYGDVDGTHGDDTMSVDSFGEFDSIFEINTPPPSKRDRKGKGKAKEKVKKESEVKRQRLRKRNRRDSTPIDLLPLAGPSKPVPLPTSPTASSRMKREPDPNSTLSPLAALPIPNADHHPHSAVRFNPATGRLRQTFFKRTPSTDKEGSIPTADGPHTTLALSRPASTNPMRFPSPSPIFYSRLFSLGPETNLQTTRPPSHPRRLVSLTTLTSG